MKKAYKAAGLSGITWHTLASRLTRKGVDMVTVKELLGHSTVTVTMRYARSNHETKLRAVKRLEGGDKAVRVLPKPTQLGVSQFRSA